MHRGDLQGALELAVEAQRYLGGANDSAARCEVAALKAQVSFFSGSYADALSEADLAVSVADDSRDRDLRIFARRASCVVFGNVGVPDWGQRLEELLRLSVDAGDAWEEAISRNDLACYLQETGDLRGAEREIDRALSVAHSVPGRNNFALGVLHSTRADIRLLGARPEAALRDAEAAIARLLAGGDPNPYVFGVTVRAQVQARMALGQLDDARESGEGALAVARTVPGPNNFALGVLHSTRADIHLLAGRPDAALRDAEASIGRLLEGGEPNPTVLGVTVRAQVQASMALGQLDDARESGEGALTWLGDRVPQMRSLILTTLATALRDAGRTEEAYDALQRACELERQAFRELSQV